MIPVELGGTIKLVPRATVRYVEAQGDYARLHTNDGASHLVRIPLAQLEERWENAGFVRIHRSYLVALPLVTELRMTSNGYAVVIGSGEGAKELPVSRRHTRELKERIVRPPKSELGMTEHSGPPGHRTSRSRRARRLAVGRGAQEPPPAGGAGGPARPRWALRTIIELEEQTSFGEKLIRDLIRTQLRTGLALGGGTLLLLALLPRCSPAAVGGGGGVRRRAAPWLLLGLLPFPLCYGVGYAYRRLAERHEQDFVSSVDR